MKVGIAFEVLCLDYWGPKLKEGGIDCIEVGLPNHALEAEAFINVAKCINIAKEAGLELWSAHLPYWPSHNYKFEISSLDEATRRYTVEYLGEFIRKFAKFGIKIFVIHPSLEPIADENREFQLRASSECLSELADIAAEEGAVLAVECLPRSCLGHNSEEILRLISSNDKLRVCLDTNHLTLESNITFIDNLRDKIITTHISDFDLVGEKHWMPGEGKLAWVPIYQKLLEVGYDGPWLYEASTSGAVKTLARERSWTPHEVFQNAQEIFSGKEPTRPSWSKPL